MGAVKTYVFCYIDTHNISHTVCAVCITTDRSKLFPPIFWGIWQLTQEYMIRFVGFAGCSLLARMNDACFLLLRSIYVSDYTRPTTYWVTRALCCAKCSVSPPRAHLAKRFYDLSLFRLRQHLRTNLCCKWHIEVVAVVVYFKGQ